MRKRLNVALIGYQFMGRAHSHALRNLHMLANDLPCEPVRTVICGRHEDGLKQVAHQFDWQRYETDWRNVVADPDVDVVDITAPGKLHCEIAVAAAEHGKHVFCEKPLATTAAEAQAMVDAAERHAVRHMVNFNYRRVPAIMLARDWISEGRLGEIYHVRATYQQDWPLSPDFPYVWRFDKETAGAGSMADKGSHIIDLARYLVGEIEQVAGRTRTFVPQRKNARGSMLPVTTDDAAVFVAQFHGGALGLFQTSRMSAGHKNALQLEVNGSQGSLQFHLERLNELRVYFADDQSSCQGFRTVSVTQAEHPLIKHWWPPGHVLGWEHTFVHQWHELITAIHEGRTPSPSFYDGMKCQQVIDAVDVAAQEKAWVKVA